MGTRRTTTPQHRATPQPRGTPQRRGEEPAERAVAAERLAAQALTGPPLRDPVEVADRLLAVQAQDPRGVRLAVRARTKGLRATDVDTALRDGSVVIGTLNRGTLHLVRSEDYWWLHSLTTPGLGTGNGRRLREEGVSAAAAERGVAVITRAMEDSGPQTRAQLRERLVAADVPVARQALAHLLMLASIRGVLVRGPIVAAEQAFVPAREWLGSPPPLDREVALAELARRYLRGHGPASDRDLARWAGLPLRDVRQGLRAIGGDLTERPDGLVDLAERPGGEGFGPPRLLGAFDPLLLGWESRAPIVGSHQAIVTVNGLFRPFALVDGRAVAIWALRAGTVDLDPFFPLDPDVRDALDADARDVRRFLSGDDDRSDDADPGERPRRRPRRS